MYVFSQLTTRPRLPGAGPAPQGVWRARVKWVENPRNPLPADLGPLPLPEPGSATPHPRPPPHPWASELYPRQENIFSLLCVSSPRLHVWLINDARGITPISLGCVIPKSDWGIERGEVTLPGLGTATQSCCPPPALLRTSLDR